MRHVGTLPFETARLLCRPFKAQDCEDMLRHWANDPKVQQAYGEPVYSDLTQVGQLLHHYLDSYQQPDVYRWAIIEKTSHQNIGQIAFCRVYEDCQTVEIEYCIGASFWGHGYAKEALAALIAWTFQNTEFRKLEAYHRAANIQSGRVLETSVMHVTKTVERFKRAGVKPSGERCYCIEREDYLKIEN